MVKLIFINCLCFLINTGYICSQVAQDVDVPWAVPVNQVSEVILVPVEFTVFKESLNKAWFFNSLEFDLKIKPQKNYKYEFINKKYDKGKFTLILKLCNQEPSSESNCINEGDELTLIINDKEEFTFFFRPIRWDDIPGGRIGQISTVYFDITNNTSQIIIDSVYCEKRKSGNIVLAFDLFNISATSHPGFKPVLHIENSAPHYLSSIGRNETRQIKLKLSKHKDSLGVIYEFENDTIIEEIEIYKRFDYIEVDIPLASTKKLIKDDCLTIKYEFNTNNIIQLIDKEYYDNVGSIRWFASIKINDKSVKPSLIQCKCIIDNAK